MIALTVFIQVIHRPDTSILYPKVWYEVGQQLNVCNDGTRAPEAKKQCYNDTSTLGWLETNIKIVKDHPALLGYCKSALSLFHSNTACALCADGRCPCCADICDDCCHTMDIGVSYQAQAFNFIRSADPYHVVSGAPEVPA